MKMPNILKLLHIVDEMIDSPSKSVDVDDLIKDIQTKSSLMTTTNNITDEKDEFHNTHLAKVLITFIVKNTQNSADLLYVSEILSDCDTFDDMFWKNTVLLQIYDKTISLITI